jgi:flagellar export protein FliJ
MSGKFRFKLEAVSKLRKQELDDKRREVAQAVRAVTDAERRIEVLTASLRTDVDALRGDQTAVRLDVTQLRNRRFYQGWLHRKLIESNETLHERRSSLAERRRDLATVNAKYKAIEKLREKQWQRHQQELARIERVEYDEIAVQQFQRNDQPRVLAPLRSVALVGSKAVTV